MNKFFTAIVLFLSVLSGCSTMNKPAAEMPLQYRDTANFTTNYLADGVLEISGVATQSGTMVPKVVRTEIVGDALDVYVVLAHDDKKTNKQFALKIKIEPNISTVRFGPDKEIIWQRK